MSKPFRYKFRAEFPSDIALLLCVLPYMDVEIRQIDPRFTDVEVLISTELSFDLLVQILYTIPNNEVMIATLAMEALYSDEREHPEMSPRLN